MFEREIRDFATVLRWTTIRSIHRQNLAEHSHMVAVYADQVATFFNWTGDRGDLLQYALWHDAAELLTGDISGPAKRKMITRDDAKAFEAHELRSRFAGEEWGEPVDPDITAIVKVADGLDEVFWIATEQQLGNGNLGKLMEQAYDRVMRGVRALPFGEERKGALSELIDQAMRQHRNGSNKLLED